MADDPATNALSQPGGRRGPRGSRTPELALADAHAALTDCGITMSPGRVRKLLKGYRRCNQGQDFGRYVTDELRRVITYRDQTGEDAVNNVVRGGIR